MNLFSVLIAFAVVGIACTALTWYLSKPLREIP